MLPIEARIVAHVSADGYLSTYVEKNALQIVEGRKYRKDRKRYQIGYSNSFDELLDQFESDMFKVFGLESRRKEDEVIFRSKRVYEKLKELGAGSSRKWFVSDPVKTSDKKVKCEWLKAFFDDESTIEKSTRRIRVKSVNLNGLKGIRQLLRELNIKSNITGPNIDKTWYLTINYKNIKKYESLIGYSHPQKKRDLKNISD